MRMLREEAPTAFLMPISWLRSATDTSIIFITPIPPTTREIAATSASIPETIVKRLLAG